MEYTATIWQLLVPRADILYILFHCPDITLDRIAALKLKMPDRVSGSDVFTRSTLFIQSHPSSYLFFLSIKSDIIVESDNQI